MLITSKRSRRSLFGRNPALKMLTDGSPLDWYAERLHHVGNDLADHFMYPLWRLYPLWRQTASPGFVLDILNFIANALCFLFVSGQRGFAAALTFVVGVKAYPIGFASKFMNARRGVTV
ncbi:MAG: hypothetical protein ACLQOO_24790 [Terriglobia bacterium]